MKIIKRKNEEEKCGSISLTYGSTTMWMGLDDVINYMNYINRTFPRRLSYATTYTAASYSSITKTTTTVKIGKIEMVNGTPNVVMLPDEKINGNITLEKAQKLMNKKHGVVTVFEVIPETQVYEMDVMEFIKVATLKVK